jgi:hypothetical protein
MDKQVYYYVAMVVSFGVGYFWGSSNGFKKGIMSANQKARESEFSKAFFDKIQSVWKESDHGA